MNKSKNKFLISFKLKYFFKIAFSSVLFFTNWLISEASPVAQKDSIPNEQPIYWVANSLDTSHLFHDPRKQEVFDVLTVLYAFSRDTLSQDSVAIWAPVGLLESYVLNLALNAEFERLEEIFKIAEFKDWNSFPVLMIRGFSEWLSRQSEVTQKRFQRIEVLPLDPSLQLGSVNQRRESLIMVMEDFLSDDTSAVKGIPYKSIEAFVSYEKIKAEEDASSTDIRVVADFNVYRTTKMMEDSLEFWKRHLLGKEATFFGSFILEGLQSISQSYREFHSPIRYYKILSERIAPMMRIQYKHGNRIFICGEKKIRDFKESRIPYFIDLNVQALQIQGGYVDEFTITQWVIDGVKMASTLSLHEFDWKSSSSVKKKVNSKSSKAEKNGVPVQFGLGWIGHYSQPNLTALNSDLKRNNLSNIDQIRQQGMNFWVKPESQKPLYISFLWKSTHAFALNENTPNNERATFRLNTWELGYNFPFLDRRLICMGLGFQYSYSNARIALLDSVNQPIYQPLQEVRKVNNDGHSIGLNLELMLRLPVLYIKGYAGAQLDLSNRRWSMDGNYLNTDSDFSHTSWYFGVSTGIYFRQGGFNEK